jgi:hypothetical protein
MIDGIETVDELEAATVGVERQRAAFLIARHVLLPFPSLLGRRPAAVDRCFEQTSATPRTDDRFSGTNRNALALT